VKLDFQKDGYRFLSDNTSKLDGETLFLKTAQNSTYYDKLSPKPAALSVEELISFWELESLKVVGVTGTNGKTTVTAAIYSFLLDLDETPAKYSTTSQISSILLPVSICTAPIAAIRLNRLKSPTIGE